MPKQNFLINLNSTNAVIRNGYVTDFVFPFISGSFKVMEGDEICVSSITLPYSNFNIDNGFYQNAQFTIKWTIGSTITSFPVTLPNGYYTLTDIQNYIEIFCIANGLYLINASGQNVYYITLQDNITYYGVQLTCYPVPTSLPAGWTQPSNFVGYPTVITTTQLQITKPNFGIIIGYSVGTYPSIPQSTTYTTLSNITPNAAPVNSYIIRCSLVNNPVQSPTDILDSMPITSSFGSNIVYSPPFEKLLKIRAGTYSSITVTFLDQNGNLVPLRDPNALISLLLVTSK